MRRSRCQCAMASSTAAIPCRSALRAAWRGHAGKSFYLVFWLPLLTMLWVGCFYLSWSGYPHYQFADHDISFLGHPELNPKGWWYWSIGMGIASIMMLPPVMYLSHRMRELTAGQGQTQRRLVSLGSFCARLSCLGLVGLALAPQGVMFDLIHKASGALAMGGGYAAILVLWSAPLIKTGKMSPGHAVLLLVSAWWGVIGFLVTQGYRFFAHGELGHVLKHKRESILLRFSLWEWMLFAAAATSFIIFFALLPGGNHRTDSPR